MEFVMTEGKSLFNRNAIVFRGRVPRLLTNLTIESIRERVALLHLNTPLTEINEDNKVDRSLPIDDIKWQAILRSLGLRKNVSVKKLLNLTASEVKLRKIAVNYGVKPDSRASIILRMRAEKHRQKILNDIGLPISTQWRIIIANLLSGNLTFDFVDED